MGSSNHQIEEYIKKNAPHINFKGCYWNNNLPTSNSPNSSIICNYSSSNDMNGGTHWIAMINLNSENGKPSLYFDSFGKRPDAENTILQSDADFHDYIKRHSHSYIYNHESLQGNKSSTCGHYCVLAVISQSIPIQGKNHGTVWKEYCSKYTTSAENDANIRNQIKL
jgi:hypothetical protein